ncbi:MAG: TonB-dependent receptor, partial [Rhizobacter sp.]|nr:TonB-dependent receptor [Rhizobacter sp.]
IMLDQVERVEIVRGNVSAIYGSGAIGGVIQVFTRQGTVAPQGRMSVEAGSRGFAKLSAGASGSVGSTRLSVSASRQTESGFSAQDASASPLVNPDRDGYANTSASFSLAHDLAPGQTIGLSLLHSQGSVDYDSAFSAPTDTQVSRTRLRTASLYTNNQITSNWTSRVSLSEQEDRNDSDETGDFPVVSHYTTRVQMLNWTNTFALAPTWRLTAGAEHQKQKVGTDDGFGDVYGHDRSVDAVFAGIDGSQGVHSAQANIRYDHVQDTGSRTTGYLGYGFEFAPGFKAIADVSTAFAAPPLGYLYAPFFGNPSLQPETSRNAEAGLQWTSGAHLVRATYFVGKVHDELQYDTVTSTFGNVARSTNRGVEVSYSGRVADTDLHASLTAQTPRDDSTGDIRQRRARTLASLSASHDFGPLQLGGGWRFAGKRPDVDNSGTAVTLDSYSVVDLTAQYRLTRTWSVFGRVENVGDAHYQTASGYNQQPRSAFVGVKWQGGL